MHYKYKKVIVPGMNGYQLNHKQTEESPIMTLGTINEYVYIYTLDLGEQHEDLNFIKITLSDEELAELKTQRFIKQSKQNVRAKIRRIKDLEDDLVDQKQLIQFMARGIAEMWDNFPQDMKDANEYRNSFDTFSLMIKNSNIRLDLEIDKGSKIAKIIQDESDFADIVKVEYLDRIR